MRRLLIRYLFGIDIVESLETMEAERDAARDVADDLRRDYDCMRKLFETTRKLLHTLRDVNRELDERNTYLESLHGMTPGERLERASEGGL
jgi:hypothetical protein